MARANAGCGDARFSFELKAGCAVRQNPQLRPVVLCSTITPMMPFWGLSLVPPSSVASLILALSIHVPMITISPGRKGWRLAKVLAWIAARDAANDDEPGQDGPDGPSPT